MLVQGLLLVAIVVLISGSILTSTIVTAKTALHHALIVQSQTAMGDATADFVAWAQDRVRSQNARTSWAPRTIGGKPDTVEFKPMCAAASATTNDPECAHAERISWVVTGSTDWALPTSSLRTPSYSGAMNMSRPVDEQRISAILSVDVDSPNGRTTYASASREITARVFDASPFVVITGVRETVSNNGTVDANQGDTAGNASVGRFSQQLPDPSKPSVRTDTRIVTTVECQNSAEVEQNDPRSGTGTTIIEAGRDGDMDWTYQTPCEPAYATPPPPPDPAYIAPVGHTFETIDGDRSTSWIEYGNTKKNFPR